MPARRAMLCSWLVGLAAAGALSLTPISAEAQVEAEPGAPADGAQAAFRRGNEKAKARLWVEALAAYEEAYRLRPAWDIAGNLGIAELELGKMRKAAEHLDEALRGFPGAGKPEQRALLEAAYQKALAKVGRIAIRTNVAGNTIVVDGVTVGTAPLARPVFVDPGRHAVEVRGTDGTGRKDVEVVAGAEVDVFLVPEGGAAAGGGGGGGNGALPPSGLDHEQEARPVWPGIALLAGGGVGLGVGLGLFVAGEGAYGDAEDLGASIEGSGSRCAPPSGSRGADCAALEDHASSAGSLHTGAGVAMGVGGALAVGGAVYLIWASGSDEPPATALFQPWVSPEALGGAFAGSF